MERWDYLLNRFAAEGMEHVYESARGYGWDHPHSRDLDEWANIYINIERNLPAWLSREEFEALFADRMEADWRVGLGEGGDE